MNVDIIRPVKWVGGATFRTVGYDADTFRMENIAQFGQRVPAHIHDHMSETFLIREGQATFWIGPERNEIHAGAGDRVVAPVGTEHTFEITSSAPATLYVEFLPAADMAHMMAIIAGLQDDGEGAWMGQFLYLERRQHLRGSRARWERWV